MNRQDNTESEIQATEESRLSPVESLTERSIRRDLRSDAIQHPLTIFSLATSILSVIYFIFFSPFFGGTLTSIILFGCAGVVAAVSFFWHYSIRYTDAYSRRVKELMELQERGQKEIEGAELKHLLGTLENGFKAINSHEGLKAMKELISEHEQLARISTERN